MMDEERVKTRRDFLKVSAAGLAGAAMLSSVGCSSETREQERSSSSETSQDAAKPVFRTLGRTGLRLPVVSMGSCYAVSLVRAALREGIVYVHTSSSYSERNHERILGEAFKGLPRDSFVVATSPDLPYRVGRRGGRSLDVGTRIDPALIGRSLDGSLARLGLDYVDIYYMVSVCSREVTLHEPYLKAYETLKREGKARFVGVGTHGNEPEVIEAAVESGFWDVVLTAYNFRQSHRDKVRSAIGRAARAGLGVVAMKTQAGVYWDRARTRKINMKAALKWVLQDENVHTAIPAFSNVDEMLDDISVMRDLMLTPEECDDLSLGERMGFSGSYCQGCGECLAQCPERMDVPAIMRGYMYALCHGEPAWASRRLGALNASGIACGRCERCEVKCALGLDVRSRAIELAQTLALPGGASPAAG